MADDKIKLPKKFDTTTRLNLEDTFGDEEITLVDELAEPDSVVQNKKEETSVTEKLLKPRALKNVPTAQKSPQSKINLLDVVSDIFKKIRSAWQKK